MADTTTKSTTPERRTQRRTSVELEGTITRLAGRPLEGSGVTVDLSDGGARLVGPAAFAVGDVVRVSIPRGDTTLEHRGLVVGRQPKSSGLATLNVAFRTTPRGETTDLHDLTSPLD
jgi:hypothetical protein